MGKVKDGGPAFPYVEETGTRLLINSGMSLRDYLAGQAIVGIIGKQEVMDRAQIERAAMRAYRIADGLLAAREQPTEGLSNG